MRHSTSLMLLVLSVLAAASGLAAAAGPRLLVHGTVIQTGSTISIRYHTAPGLAPVLDVYDINRVKRATKIQMTELSTAGTYEVQLYVDPTWGTGSLTLVVFEPARRTLDSVTLTVLETDLATLTEELQQTPAARQQAGGPSPTARRDLSRLLTGLDSQVTAMDRNLTASIPPAAAIQSLSGEVTTQLVAVRGAVAETLSRWEALTAEEVARSITDHVVDVVGEPSRPDAGETVVGKMGQLQRHMDDMLTQVAGSVEPAAVATAVEWSVVQQFSGLDHGVIGATSGATHQLVERIQALRKVLGTEGKSETIFQMLERLIPSIEALATRVSEIREAMHFGQIQAAIRDISGLLRQINGAHGVNLHMLYDTLGETASDLAALKGQVDRLQVLVGLNQEMSQAVMERVPTKKPVVKTWLELRRGTLIVHLLAVNPSLREAETVLVKAYLPKEVTREDILDLGGLAMKYDVEQARYAVHEVVALAPGESVTRAVTIRDIWRWPEETLAAHVDRAKALAARLAGTPSADQASARADEVARRVEEIVTRQAEAAASPAAHIATYRRGRAVIAAINADLAELVRLVRLGSRAPVTSREAPQARTLFGMNISLPVAVALLSGLVVLVGGLGLVLLMVLRRLSHMDLGANRRTPSAAAGRRRGR